MSAPPWGPQLLQTPKFKSITVTDSSVFPKGTFNWGISFGGGTTGITYGERSGAYTEYGDRILATGRILLTNKGSSTGTALITGLPFSVANVASAHASVSLWLQSITFANQFQGYAVPNSTTIALQEITEAGVVTNLTDADFSNTSEILISAMYIRA